MLAIVKEWPGGGGVWEQGAEVTGSSSAELGAYVAAEIPKWAALARKAGVKAE